MGLQKHHLLTADVPRKVLHLTLPHVPWQGQEGNNLGHRVCPSLFCEFLQTLAYCFNEHHNNTEVYRDRKRARGATLCTRGLTKRWRQNSTSKYTVCPQTTHAPTFPDIFPTQDKSTHTISVKQKDDHKRMNNANILKLLWNTSLNDDSNLFSTALFQCTF